MTMLVVMGLGFTFPTSAKAVPLTPGPGPGSVVVPDVIAGAAGTLLDSLASGFDTGFVAGSVRSEVWQPVTGGLAFYYQIAVATSIVPGLGIFLTTEHPFADNVTTDVSYRTSTGNTNVPPDMPGTGFATPPPAFIAPILASRLNDVISWTFSPSVNAGQYSAILVVRTNATQYFTGNGTVSGAGAAAVDVFAPIPEPGSLLLLGSGLAGLAGLARLRRRGNRASV
jgi:hypothetical protein